MHALVAENLELFQVPTFFFYYISINCKQLLQKYMYTIEHTVQNTPKMKNKRYNTKTNSRGLKEIMRVPVPCAAQHRGSVSPLHRN